MPRGVAQRIEVHPYLRARADPPNGEHVAHLALVGADTIEALPGALTRSIADLKELDAVLSHSHGHLTAKLEMLLAMIADPNVLPRDRLELLREIADEVSAFKYGAEDKIRVATGTNETVNNHASQLDLVVSQLTNFMPAHVLESIPASSTPSGYPTLFPAYGSATGSSVFRSRSELFPAGVSRGNGTLHSRDANPYARPRREAVPGPPKERKARVAMERTVSQDAPYQPRALGNGAAASSPARARNGDDALSLEPPVKRSRVRVDHDAADSVNGEDDGGGYDSRAPSPDPQMPRGTKRARNSASASATPTTATGAQSPGHRQAASRRRAKARGDSPAPAKRSRNNPDPSYGDDDGDGANADEEMNEKDPLAAGLDDAKGLPVKGEPRVPSDPVLGEATGGEDEQVYCICQRVSFGEMIGCDDDNCQTEWVRTAVIDSDARSFILAASAWTRRQKASGSARSAPSATRRRSRKRDCTIQCHYS